MVTGSTTIPPHKWRWCSPPLPVCSPSLQHTYVVVNLFLLFIIHIHLNFTFSYINDVRIIDNEITSITSEKYSVTWHTNGTLNTVIPIVFQVESNGILNTIPLFFPHFFLHFLAIFSTMKYPGTKNEKFIEMAGEWIWYLQWNQPSYKNEKCIQSTRGEYEISKVEEWKIHWKSQGIDMKFAMKSPKLSEWKFYWKQQ